ncbi:DUF4625 domain-containing protein [Flavobacterium reichenbachii]|uniref:DUF4625 domain-containing protein n=1 Tax=Flavobacterium reichenbachii TaxID=362418 RepID=A0A085ZPI9_9FLAO|nr:DUF4625 domain-containing protein [Flavobacterium reichenbachii]KFF06353.1 hypothetical protein IW19_12870 [Flavobacterium reichenbachii]OXB17429.1 hypothetical protein B0A68_03800 [Flavobacterium reichenbachii]
MKTRKILVAFLISAFAFTACDNDNDNQTQAQKEKPTIDKIELGLGNNEIGTIGEDFHFNAEVVAGDKIESVQIKIAQISTEKYSKVWSHEINWPQYTGAKNTTIHKHFDIPTDAPEGKYDFIIIIKDQNGTTLEVKKTLNIYAAGNLPVNPVSSTFTLFKNEDFFYRKGKYYKEGDSFKTGDKVMSQVTLTGVKGNGIMYLLLINKNAKHLPESVDQIDFTKVIVYDVYEHKDMAEVGTFSNVPFNASNNTFLREIPELFIGAQKDNNVPAQGITGTKAWASGTYVYMVVYKNTTYNINFSQSIEVPINL